MFEQKPILNEDEYVIKQRQAAARYRAKNLELCRARDREKSRIYREKNKDKIAAKAKERNTKSRNYYYTNIERLAPIKRQYHRNPDNRFKLIISDSKRRAKKKGFEFNITVKDIEKLWESQKTLCAYSGIPMSLETRVNDKVSIDRIDSSKGYTKDNIVLCRWVINWMKSDMTLESFKNEIRLLNNLL
jgi:hypothetical protein